MAFISRVIKLANHYDVLIGRDIGKALEDGQVYGVQNLGGVIMLVPIGEAVTPMKGLGLGGIMTDGKHYMTKKEHRAELEAQGVDEETIVRYLNGEKG